MSLTGPMRGPLRKRESSLWAREANDWYVEPEWCSLRLFQEEKFEAVSTRLAGRGTIVISAIKSGLVGSGSDLVDRGFDTTLTPQRLSGIRASARQHRQQSAVRNCREVP
jgi:hypothetical protein